jgi:hypothetical protein
MGKKRKEGCGCERRAPNNKRCEEQVLAYATGQVAGLDFFVFGCRCQGAPGIEPEAATQGSLLANAPKARHFNISTNIIKLRFAF